MSALDSILSISRFYVYREDRALCRTLSVFKPAEGFVAVTLTAADIPDIIAVSRGKTAADIIEARFRRGDLCVGGRVGGRLVGYSWAMLGWLYFGSYRMPLLENEAYLLDLFVDPELRGREYGGQIRYALIQTLADQGRTRLFSICLRGNRAARRIREKAGAPLVAKGVSVKLLNRWRVGSRADPDRLRSL